MIDFYINQINMGVMSIEDVPIKWRLDVQKAINGEDVEPIVTITEQKAEAYDIITGSGGAVDDTN